MKKTHGLRNSTEFNIWCGMRQRCQNTKVPCYYRYGGRGISVCARWEKFENFLADMGRRPSGASLERIDNDGNYEPSNCRWATVTEQARNRRNSRVITHEGRTQTLVAWAEELGLSASTLQRRWTLGWDKKDILTTPIGATLDAVK